MRKFYLVLLVGFVVVVLQNCNHEKEEDVLPKKENVTPVSKSNKCSPDTVYFVKEILPIITANCAFAGCHNAASHAAGIDLSSYDKIITTGKIQKGNASESDFYEVLNETDVNERMPLNKPKLQESSINAVRIWINQGALNNDCENICDSTNIKFGTQIWPIINSTCKGCHSGSRPDGGVSILNYSDVKALVDNGQLSGTTNRKNGFKAMPPGGAVDQCAQKQIDSWILEGAKNN